jgi:hypothetical protein
MSLDTRKRLINALWTVLRNVTRIYKLYEIIESGTNLNPDGLNPPTNV